jgi:hypothetical protein
MAAYGHAHAVGVLVTGHVIRADPHTRSYSMNGMHVLPQRRHGRLIGVMMLSAVVAAFVVVPALAVSASSLSMGGGLRNAITIPAAGDVAQVALYSTVVRKPDGRIRLGTGSLVGNNVYNTTGLRQTRTLNIVGAPVVGVRYTFGISIQNDGNRADRFKVKATGTATTSWTVKYYHGTTNITSSVVAGTYRTALLAPGAKYVITAKVSVITGDTPVTRLVTMKSVANATKVDAVKFIVKVTPCGC